MVRKIKRSVCPYDCPDTCGLLVEVIAEKRSGSLATLNILSQGGPFA